MAEMITDTHTFTVNVIQHPFLEITNTLIPNEVEDSTQFNIEYEIINTGAAGNCWGRIVNTDGETTLPGSEWVEDIAAGAVITKTYAVSSGIIVPLNGIIKIGYND